MKEEDELIEMNTIEAIAHIGEYFGVPSMYALAKSLSDDSEDGVKVQPIQVRHWLNGRKMTKRVAERFAEVYGIHITDYYAPGLFSK